MSLSEDKLDHDVAAPQTASQTDSVSDSKKVIGPHAARYAKVCAFFGFSKGYNFPLCKSISIILENMLLTFAIQGLIFAGAMLGFTLAKLQDLNYDGHFKMEFGLVPGYWYYFQGGSYRYGMMIHLSTILPAGILMVLQVTPIIRHKFITFHRVNGYLVSFLALISNAAVFVVIRHKQGGGHRIAAQVAEYLMGILTTIGIIMAIVNIRRKQIDQHRAWMLRTWFWMGTTISARLINLAATPIVTRIGGFWAVWSCDEINFLYTNLAVPFPQTTYPQCFLSNGTLNAAMRVAVKADENSEILSEIGSSYTITFGTMVCLITQIERGTFANNFLTALDLSCPTHPRCRAVSSSDSQRGRTTPSRELRKAARSKLS